MATTTLTPAPAPTTASPDAAVRGTAWVLGGLVGLVLVYSLTTLLPFVVNGLHQVPLAEVAGGRHDPDRLWPQGWASGPTGAFGLLSLQLALPAAIVAGAWAGVRGVRAHRAGHARLAVLSAATVLVAVGILGYLVSPLGTTLVAWRMD